MTYNLTLVLRSSLKDAERKNIIEGIKALIGKAKVAEKEWGQKVLAYPIKKEVSGVFLSWNIDSDDVVPLDFEKKLLNNDSILRHLLLRK